MILLASKRTRNLPDNSYILRYVPSTKKSTLLSTFNYGTIIITTCRKYYYYSSFIPGELKLNQDIRQFTELVLIGKGTRKVPVA